MVYLNRIYTRTGDQGETSLGDGTRVAKTHPRIIGYGGVDELNTVLGLVLLQQLADPLPQRLRLIQNDLFDLGADLCVPETQAEAAGETTPLRITPSQVHRLETWIDEANEQLQPLHSFILPGGSPASTYLHLARTVCRRVEIGIVHLASQEVVNPSAIEYLNRLSDLLFVLARLCNDQGKCDVLWVPGKNREE